MKLRTRKTVDALDFQSARLERANAAGHDHYFGQKPCALAGLNIKATIALFLYRGDFLPQVQRGAERLDLLQERIGQFLAGTHRNRGDVINRFVRIKLGALTADFGQRVDDMRLDLQQTELKYLEQTDRAG